MKVKTRHLIEVVVIAEDHKVAMLAVIIVLTLSSIKRFPKNQLRIGLPLLKERNKLSPKE